MIVRSSGLGCASCFGTCGELNGLGDGATPDYSTGAFYGPINGQYVTLSEFQAWQAAQTTANQAAYAANLQAVNTAVANGSTPATVNAPAVAVPVVMNYVPSVILQDNTSGSTLSGLRGLGGFNVGDSFTLSISGGQPNSPVTVVENGGPITNMGTTDANGNWSTSGNWTTTGTYQQHWLVAGIAASELDFTVGSPTASTVSSASSSSPSSSSSIVSSDIWSEDLDGFPIWAIGIAGIVGLLFFTSLGRK